MNLRKVFCLLLVCINIVKSMEVPIDVQEIAEAFDVPSSSIQYTPKTDEIIARYGESIYFAGLFEFQSEANVSMQVIVTNGHFLLTNKLRKKLESETASIEGIHSKDASVAFVGVEGVGPGGEGYVAIGYLPSQNVDFRLRVTISSEGITASDVSNNKILRSDSSLQKALRSLALSSINALSKKSEALPLSIGGTTQETDFPENLQSSIKDFKILGRKHVSLFDVIKHNSSIWKIMALIILVSLALAWRKWM